MQVGCWTSRWISPGHVQGHHSALPTTGQEDGCVYLSPRPTAAEGDPQGLLVGASFQGIVNRGQFDVSAVLPL